MTDNMSPKPVVDPASAPESSNQFWVAVVIVAGLVTLGLGLISAALLNPSSDTALGIGTAVGTIIGALATALNAPSGISKVLSAAKAPTGTTP